MISLLPGEIRKSYFASIFAMSIYVGLIVYFNVSKQETADFLAGFASRQSAQMFGFFVVVILASVGLLLNEMIHHSLKILGFLVKACTYLFALYGYVTMRSYRDDGFFEPNLIRLPSDDLIYFLACAAIMLLVYLIFKTGVLKDNLKKDSRWIK